MVTQTPSINRFPRKNPFKFKNLGLKADKTNTRAKLSKIGQAPKGVDLGSLLGFFNPRNVGIMGLIALSLFLKSKHNVDLDDYDDYQNEELRRQNQMIIERLSKLEAAQNE